MTTQGTEARRGETVGLDAKRDGPVGAADAPQPTDNAETIMTDVQQAVPVAQSPASIWLSPICDETAYHGEVRTWANPAPAVACDECGEPWVEYVRADLAPRSDATQTREAEGREPHVFLDCDGVLADFDTYAEGYFGMNPREYEKRMGSAKFWEQLEGKGDFYRNLPLMPDAMALFEGVKHLHPTILTGCPRGDWAQGQKVAWAAEHFPGVPIITCRSADKRDYAKPGDVIIDDWPQHRHRWIEMGGVFIVHHDAASSLAALFAHYPNLARDAA